MKTPRQQPLHRLIYALGIRYVGETTAKTLANAVKEICLILQQLRLKSYKILKTSAKVAAVLMAFFQNDDNIQILKRLKNWVCNMKNDKEAIINSRQTLQEQTFLFTGTLNKLKRSEAEELVEKNGGKIVSGVSSKLNYLVVGEDAGSKLEKAKKINTVKVISEDDFLELIQ